MGRLNLVAVAAVMLATVAAVSWAQEPANSEPSALGFWLAAREEGIHYFAKFGAPGIILAGLVGLYLFFRKPPEEKRHKIRWVHVSLAFVFGLLALTHALGFDTTHFLMDPRDEMLRSGTWLALAVLGLLISGGLRFWSWHHHWLWRWTHRTFQVLFVAAVCVHVIPKVLH